MSQNIPQSSKFTEKAPQTIQTLEDKSFTDFAAKRSVVKQSVILEDDPNFKMHPYRWVVLP